MLSFQHINVIIALLVLMRISNEADCFFMGKIISVSIPLALFASVVVLAFFALGILGGDAISSVYDKDYADFTYTGNLRSGRFTGYGSMRFQSGEQYRGNFALGRFNGEGTLYCEVNNWSFAGVFLEGLVSSGTFHNYGGETIAYERGETTDYLTSYRWQYEGGLSERGQIGEGTFIFADGAVYTGGFARGLADGEGTYTDASGRIAYMGGFKAGVFDGHGKYYSPEGWTYEGGFSNGQFDGEGVIVIGVQTIRGTWENGGQTARYE
jgi:hypothetical protein